ncbi:hypothetical protein BLA29_006562 [Euroglyphus maynei]|uniref:long-chain-fatty-acid--CoA ligase n=1 Tax=Euroglyphus maynei TaxID=6958 RepID=A0A1Y3B8N1_EURMA|nr:hypothetical protein BLA29_006562 [Euroglyphus maynei]
MVVGGAPLAYDLHKRIKCALNVTLIQGYGSTETSGGVFCMDFKDLSYGRVGSPLNGVRVRVVNWPEGNYFIDDKPNPRGELIIGGEMISSGYLDLEEASRAAFFNDDGIHWFITGDIAEIHSDGTFSIIDRKKDIVKLANGEFISLGKIEATLKSSCYVDNICIVPNATLNCLVALIVPNLMSIKSLIGRQLELTKQLPQLSDPNLLIGHPEIIKIIHNDIIDVGIRQRLKSLELPSMITLCEEIWAPDNDLLTAAMKLKRANIIKHYNYDLQQMWSSLRANPEKIRLQLKK